MDATVALRSAENSLRDFIASVLSKSFGPNWIDKCGVTPDRIQQWRDRKKEEDISAKSTGAEEKRLIYYANFDDLGIILKKNWNGEFKTAFGEQKTFMAYFDVLARIRQPDAHGRVLMPHQIDLAKGISGEIRTRIVRYRSLKETSEDCFPRIESAKDNLGNSWSPGDQKLVQTKNRIRKNDFLEWVVIARDPEDKPLHYQMRIKGYPGYQMKDTGTFGKYLEIGENVHVVIYVISQRNYHAFCDGPDNMKYDDAVTFAYTVLPPRLASS